MKHVPVNPHLCHADTTNFSVYSETMITRIVANLSALLMFILDKRVDLLCFTISIVTDEKEIPFL